MCIEKLCDLYHTRYYLSDLIKNEMGRTRGMYGGEEKCIQGSSGETWRRKTAWIILKWILSKMKHVEWIYLAQNRDQCWALGRKGMKLWVL